MPGRAAVVSPTVIASDARRRSRIERHPYPPSSL